MTSHAAAGQGPLSGRDALLADLSTRLSLGQTVVIHGPPGIGKTAVVRELESRANQRGIACGLSSWTPHLSDITHALAAAFPDVAKAAPQRVVRSRLRNAALENQGVLLLDHFQARGAPVKGFLRSLRGTGLGVLIAIDTLSARDHAALRAQCWSATEIEVPRLALRHLRRLWSDLASDIAEPLSLQETDRIVHLAQGRPGYLVTMAHLLARQPGRGRLSIGAAHIDVVARLALGEERGTGERCGCLGTEVAQSLPRSDRDDARKDPRSGVGDCPRNNPLTPSARGRSNGPGPGP